MFVYYNIYCKYNEQHKNLVWLLRIISLKVYMWYCSQVLSSLRVCAVNILQLLVFLCVWPLQPLSPSVLCSPLLSPKKRRWSLTWMRGQEEWYFFQFHSILCPLCIVQPLCNSLFSTTKDSQTILRSPNLILSPIIVKKKMRAPPQDLRSGQSVNLVFFHIVSHATSPCTPNSLVCTSISGSIVALLHNSEHYQP